MGTGSSKSLHSSNFSSYQTGDGNYPALLRLTRRTDFNRNTSATTQDADSEGSEDEKRRKTQRVASKFKRVSLKQSELRNNLERRSDILRGNLDHQIHDDPKVIRIFTSSTFTDTKQERNALMQKVYPELKSFCHQFGYDFQVVDMRWGLRDEATDNHTTTELCLREIELCKSLSTGPFFVTFVSHKYGSRPLPRTIQVDEFEVLLDMLTKDNDRDKTLIKKWYMMDKNTVPPCYVLLPLTRHYPDHFTNKASAEAWNDESRRMKQALIKAARQALPKAQSEKYEMSVTAHEISTALSGGTADGERAFWFHRVFTDIEIQQNNTKLLSKYIDKGNSEEEDEKCRKLMRKMKLTKLNQWIPSDQIFTYRIPWHAEGVSPDKITSHRQYIDRLCQDFRQALERMISEAVEKKNQQEEDEDLYKEVMHHAAWCQNTLHGFKGRNQTLQEIRKYIQGTNTSPLVVYGESGSGKSSLLAKVAKMCPSWKSSKALVIVRSLGITTESSDVTSLLRSLIHQIDRVLHPNAKVQPIKTVKTLSEILKRRLKEAGSTQPIIIILDDLDLPYQNAATRDLNWIPSQLPTWVKLVVSVVADDHKGCFSSLKMLIPDESQFLCLPKLSRSDAEDIVDDWLNAEKRSLTPHQREIMMKAFRRCQLPLFLKLSFIEASRWKSFDPPGSTVLKHTVKESIMELLNRVEKIHGRKLVSKALGYINISKNGLTENELEDILSCDDDVLNDIYQFWTPPVRRLPPLTMIRLRADLNYCTVLKIMDGVQVTTWFHKQFAEAATKRYCSEEETTRQMHMAIAEYYLGTWAGVAKPYKDSTGEHRDHRYAEPQPLKFAGSYNTRKLLYLPYHLIQAGECDLLKSAALLNLEFLLAKLKACSLSAVLNDFVAARDAFPQDDQLKLVQEAIQLSQVALLYDENQLPGQLIGRLPLEKEFILGEPVDLPVKYFIPDKKILIPPGGQLVHSLGGHTQEPTCMDMTSDGKFVATASHDESVIVWDVKKGIIHRQKDHVVNSPEHLYICSGDKIIAVNSDLSILGIDLNTTQVLYEIRDLGNDLQENLAVCGLARETLIVPVGQVLKVFSAETGQQIKDIKNTEMNSDEKFGCFDPITAQGHVVAIATEDSSVLRVADILCGEFRHNRQMLDSFEDEEACIYAIEISPDQTTIVFASSVENDIYICDLATLNTQRIIGGRQNDIFKKFRFTLDGKILYFPNGSMFTCVNILNGTLKDRLIHPTRVTDIISTDLTTVVSICEDCAVRIWNLISDSTDINSAEGPDAVDIPNTGQRMKELTFLSLKAESGHDTLVMPVFIFRDILPMKNRRYVLVHSEDVNCENIQLYDVIQKRPVRNARIKSDGAEAACEVMLLGNNLAVISTGCRKAYLVDLNTMTAKHRFQGMLPSKVEYCVDVTVRESAKELVAFTRGRRHLKLYDLLTGVTKTVMKLECGHKLLAMLLSPDERLLAVGTQSRGPLILIDIDRRQSIASWNHVDLGCYPMLTGAIFTTCGSFLALCSEAVAPGLGDYEVYTQVISTSSGKLHKHLIDQRDYKRHLSEMTDMRVGVTSSCILKDQTILIGSQDGVIRVWNMNTGHIMHRLLGHTGEVTQISVSDLKTEFVSHSSSQQDGAFRLWDAQTFECLASFKPDNEISHIQLNSDCHMVLAGDTMTREVVTWSLEGCGDVGPTPEFGPVHFEGVGLGFQLELDKPTDLLDNDDDLDTDVDDPIEDDLDDLPEEDESFRNGNDVSRAGYEGDTDDSSDSLSLL